MGSGAPRLFVTSDAAIREVTAYRCEGAGRDVGHSILRPLWKPAMDLNSTMRLAAYMLAIVKNNVPGCSGPSQFADFGTFGFPVLVPTRLDVAHVENVHGWFDQMSSEFLLKHMCDSDGDFDSYLKELQRHARHMRGVWKKQVSEAMKRPRRLTKGGRKSRRPSRGSPRGSSES